MFRKQTTGQQQLGKKRVINSRIGTSYPRVQCLLRPLKRAVLKASLKVWNIRVQHAGQTSYYTILWELMWNPKIFINSLSMKSDQGANPQKNEICHSGIEIKNVKPNTTVPFTFFQFFPIAIAHLIPWYTWHQENGSSFMETCERWTHSDGLQ